MHNWDLIAQEDVLYVDKPHRKGVGKMLVKLTLENLKSRNVKRLDISTMTDLRVSKLLEKMNFKHTCANMTYTF
jgi:GNAT superfamily N-acetyltransferase